MLTEIADYFQNRHRVQILDPAHYETRFEIWRRLRRNFNAALEGMGQLQTNARPTGFEILDYKLLDAAAYLNEGRGLIGINFASLLLVEDYFFALLSRPDLFQEVGDPSLEIMKFEQFEAYTTSDESRCPRFSPECPVRAQYALLLMFIALEYMFLHEVTHILSGHHLYLRKRNVLSANAPLRMQSRRTPFDKARLQQTVEFDADWYAFQIQSEMVRSNAGILCDYSQLNLSKETLLRAVVVAMLTYFLFLNTTNHPLSRYKMHSHPHPYLRILTFVGTWRDNFRTADPALMLLFDQTITDTFDETLGWWGEQTSGGGLRIALLEQEHTLQVQIQDYMQMQEILFAEIAEFDLRQQLGAAQQFSFIS